MPRKTIASLTELAAGTALIPASSVAQGNTSAPTQSSAPPSLRIDGATMFLDRLSSKDPKLATVVVKTRQSRFAVAPTGRSA